MKVIRQSSDIKGLARSVVTVGVFDGVHTGHQNVIRRLEELKRQTQASHSILLTFDRHPLTVTHPERAPLLLTTLDEKLSLLADLDIDIVLVEQFTAETAAVDYRTFIARKLCGELKMKHLVVGYDFHLGRGRVGAQEQLVGEGRRSGFGVTIVPPVVLCGSVVSSTKIRRAIRERKLRSAARWLTRPYFFDAAVVKGAGVGRALDFPTANVEVRHREKLLPSDAVYAVSVKVGEQHFGGMMNIGTAPTMKEGKKRNIEVHLFGFSGDLYTENLRISCLEFIREEKRFDTPAELREQLARDRDRALSVLQKKH